MLGTALAAFSVVLRAEGSSHEEQIPFAAEPAETSELGEVRLLALRFSDTVDHGRAIRPPQPGESWAAYMAPPFEAGLGKLGVEVDHLPGPDFPPQPKGGAKPAKDGTPFAVSRDRKHWLGSKPKRRKGRRADRFDAFLLGDFAHRQTVRFFVRSSYWARFTLLNREGKVVFSKVYPAALSTLAFNINRVNREAKLLETEIPALVLADLEPFLKPKGE